MSKVSRLLQTGKRTLVRLSAVLLSALVFASGVSLAQSGVYLPALDGDIPAIAVSGDRVLCAVSRDQDSLLLELNRDGTLLGSCRMDTDQVFQSLAVGGQTVYAIMASDRDGETRQTLVSLSLEDRAMQPSTLLDLSHPPDVTWQSLSLTDEGRLLLGGRDRQGNGYALSYDLASGASQWETVVPEGDVLFLNQLTPWRTVWVTGGGQVNLLQSGQTTEDLLSGQLETPQQLTALGETCFLSDSITGDIYQIHPDGSAELFRDGAASIPSSGYSYSQYSAYTVYFDAEGALRTAGVCSSQQGACVVGEGWQIQSIDYGSQRLLLFWRHCWPIALAVFLLLCLASWWLERMLCSPRLSTRLTLWELLAALLLLGAVTAIQYRSYQDTLLEEAGQTLRLLGGSAAVSLESDVQMSDQELLDTVSRLEEQVLAPVQGGNRACSLRVLWATPDGPAMAYDETLPAGYLLEDVEPHNYLSFVSTVLRSGGEGTRMIRGEISTFYLHVQTFRQGSRTGCVAVSLPLSLIHI